MQPTTIDWADYSYNPIKGCDFGCKFCYAKKFTERYKIMNDFTKAQFYESEVEAPIHKKKGGIIFLGSIAGIFSKGINDTDIQRIIRVMEECPQHIFMILEKRPEGFGYFKWPGNCYIGTSIDLQSTGMKRIETLRQINTSAKKFVSVEPICGYMDKIDFSFADLVIVGAQTGTKPVIPVREWVNSVKHHNIFYKDNICKYFPDLPHGSKTQIKPSII